MGSERCRSARRERAPGSPTQPAYSKVCGIKLPQQYFANSIDIGTLSVGGFYTGVLGGELAVYRSMVLGPLINGIEFPATFYPSIVLQMTSTSVQRIIKGTGDHRVDVLQYVAEHSTSPAWAVTVYDVDDASNHLYGFVRWYNAATGGTADHSFVKNGGTNLGSQEMGSTWGASSGMATDPLWAAARDIAVASGNDAAGVLAIGNAGGAVSRINGAVAWNSRTSMPTAATGDRVWRTDLQGEWFYNGTIWLSPASQLGFPFSILPPLAATGVGHRLAMPQALGGSDVYLASVAGGYYVDGGTALSSSTSGLGPSRRRTTQVPVRSAPSRSRQERAANGSPCPS